MKFVIVSDRDGIERALLGFVPIGHADLAAFLITQAGEGARIVSAGFVEFHDDKAFVFGNSASLKIGPRPNDSIFLTAFYRATVRQGREQDAKQNPV